MATGRNIEVRIGNASSRSDSSYVGSLPRAAFVRFTYRSYHFNRGFEDTLWLPASTDAHAAKSIFDWMAWNLNQDLPAQLPLPTVFDEGVELSAAAKAFEVKSTYRQNLQAALKQYVRGAALTLAEFRLVWEKSRDRGVMESAVSGLIFRHGDGVRYGFEGVPERKMIMAFAEARGISIGWMPEKPAMRRDTFLSL